MLSTRRDCFSCTLIYVGYNAQTYVQCTKDTENGISVQKIIKSQRKRAREEINQRITKLRNQNKMAVHACQSILTLDVNGLNSPIVRHRVAEWIIKQRPIYMVPTKDLLQMKGYTQTGSEGMEKEYSCKWKTKKKEKLW